MSFNVVCLLFCGAVGAFFTFTGDLCLAACFAIATWVFWKLERQVRRVLNRPDRPR